jgi:glycosyltransferase involved in cell wall biosynthesis
MKILFDVEHPFAWAHGGVQVLVENLMKHLKELGVEVDYVKWWDPQQKGDIVSVFCPPTNVLRFAKQKGIKVAAYIFLDGYTSKTRMQLYFRQLLIFILRKKFHHMAGELGWNYQEIADVCIYPSDYDRTLGHQLFGMDPKRSFVILHGVDEKYLNQDIKEGCGSDYLVSVGTIHPRKNTNLLARLAKELKIPILFIGKPYDINEPYYKEFLSLVDDKYVLYRGFLSENEKINYLKDSRGYILLSKQESGCIAVLEAFALKRRVFLPDLPWARAIYDGHAEFGHLNDFNRLKLEIKDFYNSSTGKEPLPVLSWREVAKKYLEAYQSILGSN